MVIAAAKAQGVLDIGVRGWGWGLGQVWGWGLGLGFGVWVPEPQTLNPKQVCLQASALAYEVPRNTGQVRFSSLILGLGFPDFVRVEREPLKLQVASGSRALHLNGSVLGAGGCRRGIVFTGSG